MNEQSSGRTWRDRERVENTGEIDPRTERDRRALDPGPVAGSDRRGSGGPVTAGRAFGPADIGGTEHRDTPPSPRSTELTEARGHRLDAYFGPTNGGDGGSDDDLNNRKYVALLLKHRWPILGSCAIFLLLGLGATLLTTPIYRASTTLQIDRA